MIWAMTRPMWRALASIVVTRPVKRFWSYPKNLNIANFNERGKKWPVWLLYFSLHGNVQIASTIFSNSVILGYLRSSGPELYKKLVSLSLYWQVTSCTKSKDQVSQILDKNGSLFFLFSQMKKTHEKNALPLLNPYGSRTSCIIRRKKTMNQFWEKVIKDERNDRRTDWQTTLFLEINILDN